MKITEKQLLRLWNCFVADLQKHQDSNALFGYSEKLELQKEITDQQSAEIVENDKSEHQKMKFIAGSQGESDKSS